MTNELEYLVRREHEEAVAAKNAVNKAVAAVHRELAARYARRARSVRRSWTAHDQDCEATLSRSA